VRGYRKGFIAVGIGLTICSFVFLFPYIGFTVNRHFADITGSHISVTGIEPENPLILIIFALLICIGTGLFVKGFK
jgi:H+/Cl- antiporter ClcA